MSLRITKCKIWGSRSAIKSTERHLELSSTEYNPFFIILKITRLKIPHLKKVCSNKIKSVKHISEDEIPRAFFVCVVVVVFGAISTSAPWTAT